MIHVVVELADVDFQAVPRSRPVQYQRLVHILHALVEAATLDASIGVLDEDMPPVLPEHLDNHMVDDPVREERGYHQPSFLRLQNPAYLVLSGNVGLVIDHLPQLLQPLRDMFVELTDFITVFLAFLGLVLCLRQRVGIIEQMVEVSHLLCSRNGELSSPFHIEHLRLHVRVIYVLLTMGIAIRQRLCIEVSVPLAQIRAFNIFTHTDSTFSFFYQLSAVPIASVR